MEEGKDMQKLLEQTIARVVGLMGYEPLEFVVEHPRDETHGDYAANVAMLLAGKQRGGGNQQRGVVKNPRELAAQMVDLMQKDVQIDSLIQRIEVEGPGFINFWLREEWLLAQASEAGSEGYGKNTRLEGKRVMVEYTDPNPFKEFHIGHLMSNTVGEAAARLLEAQGATVRRVCYQGDVGLHVAKALWGYTHLGDTAKQGVARWGAAYAYGATRFEESEEARAEIVVLNKVIYERGDDKVNKLYDEGKRISLEYFETIYARLGTRFDEYFFESEAAIAGKQIVAEGLEKGVLEKGEDGAIIFRGERYGLHTRVFCNKLGLPTYEGKELGLVGDKLARWQYDKSYIITANEIDEYFKVLLKVLELLRPELGAKTRHLSHGVMKLTSGKMSSRTGKVVTGEGLLDELKGVVLAKMGERNINDKARVADTIAVAALKWSVLKQAIGGDIVYDPKAMTNLEGDTGPYVQYTYARARSILRKAQIPNPKQKIVKEELSGEERQVLRWLYRYPEVVEQAGRELSPHLLTHYLLELASRFNTLYAKCEIIGYEGRLDMTRAVAKILKSGLGHLGIEAPEEM